MVNIPNILHYMNNYCYFCGKITSNMDKDGFNKEMRRVLDLAVKDTGNLPNKSIKELFTEKVNELGISESQVLKLLGMQPKTLKAILDYSGVRIDVINVIKLGHFLGLSLNEIMKIYIPEMEMGQIGEIQSAKEASFMMEYFDIPSLRKAHFISTKEIENLKNRVTIFFGLDTIYDYSETSIFPAFSRSKRSSNDKVRDFWLKSAYTMFKGVDNPNAYNRKELLNILPRIRPYTKDVERGLTAVARALYNLGITVIFQPSIANLQVKGATFLVNDKPCIVLSDLNKRYPTIWFVLLHELHHVLYDLETLRQSKFYYHLTGEPDLFLLDEVAADTFAKDYLLSDERLKFIAPLINSKTSVSGYAESWGIHPSIIYSFYCQEYHAWGHPVGRKIPSSEQALRLLNTNPFERATLEESIKELKELVYNI